MTAYPRRILELFGIEVPVIQAPMLGVTTLYVANQGVTMKLRFGGKAVPT